MKLVKRLTNSEVKCLTNSAEICTFAAETKQVKRL